MDWQLITLLAMFLFALLYVATLYHLAHGRERKAVELGARLVMEALTRDGRLLAEAPTPVALEPVNIGEEDYEMRQPEPPRDKDGEPIPDIIVARNEKAAQQIGEKIMDDLLRYTDGTTRK